ncbi:MAG: DUF1501 domain-containing protein [Planctomycetia bacterium]|nr:DUF1501 domain-containing protein [Planctomycetia bacterium]
MITLNCSPKGLPSPLTRRRALQIGTLGGLGLGLPDLFRSRAAGAPSPTRCRAVILVWLDGGASQFETYDPKPDAPAEFRGPLATIATSTPGVQFGESFPLQARLMDKVSVVRTVTNKSGDHYYAAHWVLTGFESRSNGLDVPDRYPSAGSIVARTLGARHPGVPPYVAVPYASAFGHRPGFHGAAYLGRPFDPFETIHEPHEREFQVPNMKLDPQLTVGRLEDRRALLAGLDQMRRGLDDVRSAAAMDVFHAQALDLISRKAIDAFNLESEDPKTRDRYGRHLYGQSALLARRLVEAGVSFVTIHSGSLGGWDHHYKIKEGMPYHAPTTDQAVAALINDLEARGLLDEVLVWVTGDLGRTPRMNEFAGRDHWDVMSMLFAGGGCRRGNVVGETNSRGEYAADNRTTPADVLATIYHLMGIDPSTSFTNHAGRPIPIANDGRVIRDLV